MEDKMVTVVTFQSCKILSYCTMNHFGLFWHVINRGLPLILPEMYFI